MKGPAEKPLGLTLRWRSGEERELRKRASPRVETERCINCGTCLLACPTGAINEVQRQICRLCPDCAEGPVMFPWEMEELTRDSCSLACPLGHFPEGYVNLLARGDWEGAWELVEAVNPLPGVLGRICSRPCEERCKRGILIDRPLPIRAMKREIAEEAFRKGRLRKRAYTRSIDVRVAVAGGGPAGLAAAVDLASLGYKVTIFEAGPSLGGLLRLAVPAFRLPDEVWEREYEAALGDGIEVVTGAAVGYSPRLQELIDEGFKAVILALGAPIGKRLDVPGSDFVGVHDALGFMTAVKGGEPLQVGEKVLVVGGGSVATDVARTALRCGGREVYIACIEEECDLPALAWEVEEARREGVRIMAGYSPVRILSSWMKAEAVEMARVRGICSDMGGGIIPEIDEGSGMTVAADTVIFAVGQRVDAQTLGRMGLEMTEWGALAVEVQSGATSERGVFAAGDLVTGQGSVVEAMASGRWAARAADGYLAGRHPAESDRSVAGAPLEEKIFPVRLERIDPMQMPHIEAKEALESMREVEGSPAREDLETDARRCMRCGYIQVDHDLCLGCGICRELCPAGDVITMGPPRLGGDG